VTATKRDRFATLLEGQSFFRLFYDLLGRLLPRIHLSVVIVCSPQVVGVKVNCKIYGSSRLRNF